MKKQISFLKSSIRNSPLRSMLMNYRHRGLRDSDVFLASYPKSGNTWLRHLLTYVITGQSTEWRGELSRVSVMVGRHRGLREVLPDDGRLIKTHESYRPDYRRAIFLVRDARDVAISEFHYQRNYSPTFIEYDNNFDIFFERFLKGTVNGYGSWHQHTRSWLESPAHSAGELLVIRFEDLKSDTFSQLRRTVDFLGIEADDAMLQAAIDDTSVTNMKEKERKFWEQQGKENPNFVRKAKSGNWQELITGTKMDAFRSVATEAMQIAGYQM